MVRWYSSTTVLCKECESYTFYYIIFFYFPALNVASDNVWSPPQEGESEGSEGKTALELLKQEQAQSGIVTFSAQIDEMLGEYVLLMCTP